MYTKQDFLDVIAASVTQYPEVAALYQAGDPRVLQQQQANAQMLAMVSQQLELCMIEPFSKVRDATVLADASIRGLVPMATPSRVKVRIDNSSATAFQLAASRQIIDSSGNVYEVDLPVTVPANDYAFAELVQRQVREFTHVVTESKPFYKIEVPQPDDGRFIAGIRVFDEQSTEFQYRQGYVGASPAELIFNIECDEYQRIYVAFGYDGVVGSQLNSGRQIRIRVNGSLGDVRVASGSSFSFQYSYIAQDAKIKITMDSLLIVGANPADIATLRELCKYPSIYDSNAVFMGEFDFLVRRNVPDLRFLSIWNESIEESVRGASVNNIGALFVSFTEPSGANRAAVQEQIKSVILNADDSFKIVFVSPVISLIAATINASVARVNDASSVDAKIKEVMLAEYGVDSPSAKIGMSVPQYKRVYELLRDSVPALQDVGADFTVAITPPSGAQLPEQYRYMTDGSLTINVTQANYNLNGWGH